MKKFFAVLTALAMMMLSMPLQTDVFKTSAESAGSLKFDFGGAGAEDGYTGVSASDGYSSSKGYGFSDTGKIENVTAGGKGCVK